MDSLKILLNYILYPFVMYMCLSCVEQSDNNKLKTDKLVRKNQMWYKEQDVNLGYRIDMVNSEFGYAISRGKGDIEGQVYIYKNNLWNSFTSFDYSDYPSIKHLQDSSFIYLIHETHHGNYKPRLFSVNEKIKREIELPDIMWDDRDYSMWKGLSITDKNHLWLAGQKGNVISQQGNNWYKKNILQNNEDTRHFLINDINDICMLSDTTGWAVGKNGSIYKYISQKWIKESSLTDQPLNRISMVDNFTGLAVGDKGTVLKCTSGKWEMLEVPSRESFYSLKILDKDNIWIVGTHSTLLKYEAGNFIPDESVKIFNDTFMDIDAAWKSNGNPKIWIIGNEGIYTTADKFDFSFTDITSQSSLTRDGMCGIFFNHNNDVYTDLLIMTEEGPNLLFDNSINSLFSEIPRKNNLVKYLGIANTILTGDFNNDGNSDLLEVLDNSEFQLSLGIGEDNFIDWTKESQIDLSRLNTRSQFFSTTTADLNNDGALDIYVSNFNDKDFLFINNGVGVFKNVWDSSGINKQLNQECMGSVLSDFNNDNLIDILLIYRLGENSQDADLFLNEGDLLFRRIIIPEFISEHSEVTFSAIAEDFNNDGNMDIVIYNNEAPLKLLLNNGKAEFTNASAASGFISPISHIEPSHGLLSAADINNDGWMDIFAGSKLFLNSPELVFEDITNYSGINFKGNSTFSDIDFDGDYDVYIGSSKTALGDGNRSALFRNNLIPKDFFKVKLYPDISNLSGIGTRIQLTGLTQSGDTMTNTTQYCGLGANPLTQKDYSFTQFAITDTLKYFLIVTFPSGNIQTFSDIISKEIISVYESSFLIHHLIIILKAFERTSKLINWSYEPLKLIGLVVSILITLFVGRKYKSYRIINKWYYFLFVFLLYMLLVHFTIIHGELYSLLYTFIPINIFLYSFLFISHKIIERKESKYISHYKILETLGSGAMGNVYKAVDINTSCITALKVLKPEIVNDKNNRDMILNEGKTLLNLNHPNIIKVFEIGSSDEHTFIAMEYLPCGTLHEFVASNFPLELNTFIGIALDICRGLSTVHSNNIIHRDLKSQNIMFNENKNIKILDFGLSKNPVYVTNTTGHGGIGTLGFMAPEQVTSSNIDHRADIFSLGIIMYYMATNSVPFSGENEIALIHSIFNKEPLAPSQINNIIPNSIDSIIFRCLEKLPSARFNNVQEIISELENIHE